MAKNKKSTKEEMAKAKDELGKVKSEWQKLPKSGKIGTAVVGAVLLVVLSAFIFGNNGGSDLAGDGGSTSKGTSGTASEVDSAEAAEEEESEESSELDDLIDSAELEDGALSINKELTSFFSENTMLKHDVYDYFELMGEFFNDDRVDSVKVILETAMIDQKGNEEIEPVVEFMYSRSDFEELNYENFLDLSFSQTWRIFNESTEYFIHPGIYDKVDTEYTDNLDNGNSKVQLVGE